MKKEFLVLIILGLIIIILLGVLIFIPGPKSPDNLFVKNLSIKSGQKIKSPLVVEGEARLWYFEGSFPIKITDKDGNVLGSSYVQAQSEWMTENFVPFKGEISFISDKQQNGFLILMKDNPSGLPENDQELKIPVIIESTDTMKIRVYFNNNNLDPEFSCNKVFPVERIISKTEAVASASMAELLKGPTQAEKDAGFFTSINDGVMLQALMIGMESGTTKVDFSKKLEEGVGGSCRVSAVRAQITETLKQFSTVKSVIISINGRTEDILQP